MSSLRTKLARVKQRSVKGYLKVLDSLMDTDRLIRYTYHHNGYHNPDYSFDDQEINFLHLPKTGGTSVSKMLAHDPAQRFGKLDIHRPVSKNCSPAEYRYVTVMRDPVARVWSYYQMVLRSQKGYPYRKWADQGLEIFLKKCWAARNMSCRYLSGAVEAEPDENTFIQASENLRQFYAVLDFNNFSNDVSQFLTEHDIPFEQIPNERNHVYVAPEEIENQLIKKYNKWDIALFESWSQGLDKEAVFDQSTASDEKN